MLNSKYIQHDCYNMLQDFDITDLKNKKFLITGSNGLIGNYIVNFLDIANRAFDANVSGWCISKHKPLWKADKFKYYALDLSEGFEDHNFYPYPNYVIHGACYATPSKFLENAEETVRLNVHATLSMLEFCKMSASTFLFLSSGAIYGEVPQSELPIKEACYGYLTPYSVRAPYAESKRLAETLCNIYKQKVVRLGYIYGPGNCDGRVMSDFMKMAITNNEVTIN